MTAINKPLETLLKPDVQKIFDHFSSCFNIRILFYSPSGHELKVGLDQPDSQYCKLIQEKIYGEQACLALDEMKRDEAAKKGSLICYECHAGLIEAVMPICFGSKLLGFVAIGQFRSRDTLPQKVMEDCNDKQPMASLQKTYLQLPYVVPKRIDDILGLFRILVDYIVMQHMVTLIGNSVVETLLSYMESNVGEDISLKRAAELVGKSPSTVSHIFTKELGKSFKQTLTEIKLRKAEELMARDRNISIAEVASQVGYSDPLYFSRLYKKYRNHPPSAYLRTTPL